MQIRPAHLQPLLVLFPGDAVYEGQVIGMCNKAGDLKVNVCKSKALTNMRAAQTSKSVALDEPRVMGLDEALEYITDDEQVRRAGGGWWGVGGGGGG